MPGLSALGFFAFATVLAQTLPAPSGTLSLEDDATLVQLVGEALANRPELAESNALIEAAQARIPQAGVLPDPMLSLGIQNDGFRGIQIGVMDTSFVSISASQTFPWWGKRGLRSEVVESGVDLERTTQSRLRLSIAGEVDRAYLDLLLVRDRLLVLARLDALWTQSAELTRVRYESGEGAQSDILRAQLERSRIAQRRFALKASETEALATLNRVRHHPPGDEIPTRLSLQQLADPPVFGETTADAARFPELARSELLATQAGKQIELARKDAFPDLTVSAGIMPRGAIEPMWQLGLSVNLPVWIGSKQAKAVAEFQARQRAAERSGETVKALLAQRIAERKAALDALRATNQLYRNGLLVQSEATVTSTLAQYQVGRVTFVAVLEALAGYLNDYEGFLQSVAAAQRIAIAQRELSLDPVASPSGAVMATPASSSAPSVGTSGGTTPGM